MKALLPALQAHLDDGTTTLAWCWRITPARKPRWDIDFDSGTVLLPKTDSYRTRLPGYGFWRAVPGTGASDTNVAGFTFDPAMGDKTLHQNDGAFYCIYDIDVADLPAGMVITYSDLMHLEGTASAGVNDQIICTWYTLAQATTLDGSGLALASVGSQMSPIRNLVNNTVPSTTARSLSVTVPAGAKMIRIMTRADGAFYLSDGHFRLQSFTAPVLTFAGVPMLSALGFTDHDQPISFDGTSFEPESGFAASEIRSGSDLAVDAQDATGVLTSDRITETDIIDGRWDNAAVELWRVNWADPSQRVLMRRGVVGQIRRGRVALIAEVRSLAHSLGQTVGRTFQANCDAALGDARCGINLDVPEIKGTGAVIDILRDRAFTASGMGGFAAGWFTFGTFEWTSGANSGRRTEVLGHDLVDGVAVLTLLEAPVRPIAAADAFIIRAGCDKSVGTCGAKFANTARFRGFPHIPGQDAVLRYATTAGGHEGAVL